MAGQPTPPLIQEAFAKNANPAYIQNPIPLSTSDPARASFNLGFPPQSMTEIFAGGTPPYGQDVNGILNMLSAHIVAAQAGQPYLYNATLSGVMGGYAQGAVVGMADGSGLWLNNVSGNTTDPDGVSAAGWLPLYSYGFASVTTTGGAVFLTAAQSRRGVVVVGGSWGGNVQLILPTSLQSWLIVNNATTNGFTLVVRTASGSGVTVPAGGFSGPTEVYGDGTNIYPTVAPITIPTDVNPTANTIALRSSSGYLFATYFNSSNGLENFSATGIYASAGDGFHRLISLANIAAQISLSQFAGAVVAGQVPAAAVTQYAALIWANAALTGAPTSTTPALGDRSTRIATTAYVNPSAGFSSTLIYQQFASGLILQAGFVSGGGGGSTTAVVAVTFTNPFPNACVAATCSTANRTPAGASGSGYVSNLSRNGFNATLDVNGTASSHDGYWFAFGY